MDALVSQLRAGAPGHGEGLYEAYRTLRRTAPVYRCPWGDWYVSSHLNARTLLLGRNTMRQGELASAPMPSNGASAAHRFLQQWLLCLDPPAHTMLRNALAAAFSPPRIEQMRPAIRSIAAQLWKEWLRRPEAEIVDVVTQPLPVLVIARLLGLPEQDFQLFRRWNHVWRTAMDRDEPEAYAAASTTSGEAIEYLQAHVDRAGSTWPGAFDYRDLIDRCGREAVVANLGLLLFAGSETTGHLLSSLMLLLGRHRDVWRGLKSGTLPAADIVAEALRYESPVQKIAFRAIAPTELDGAHIGAGETIVILVGAAHRDPAIHMAPDRFDAARRAAADLAFGAGAHACLGRRLALVEADIFLEVAASLLEEVEVGDGGWRWLPETTFRALERLDLQARQSTPARAG